jgi:hypothetical protein
MDLSGITDVLDDNFSSIAAGLQVRHLPHESEMLTAPGFPEVAAHVPALVHMARLRAGRSTQGVRNELDKLVETLNLPPTSTDSLQDNRRARWTNRPPPVPPGFKSPAGGSRAWARSFKALPSQLLTLRSRREHSIFRLCRRPGGGRLRRRLPECLRSWAESATSVASSRALPGWSLP